VREVCKLLIGFNIFRCFSPTSHPVETAFCNFTVRALHSCSIMQIDLRWFHQNKFACVILDSNLKQNVLFCFIKLSSTLEVTWRSVCFRWSFTYDFCSFTNST